MHIHCTINPSWFDYPLPTGDMVVIVFIAPVPGASPASVGKN